MEVCIKNVSKKMLKNQALENVSLEFEKEKIHCIVGPNGAGKTTLMRLIAGLLKADSGQINYFNDGKKTNLSLIKNKLGYFPQEQSLYADLTCMEHLKFFGNLYDIDKNVFKHQAIELLEMVNLSKFQDRKAGNLSGGMYKKLELICVLLNHPLLLLLDEPTIGVDPLSRKEIWDLIYQLSKNMTIILTTSYMDEAQKCTKAHILDGGKVIDCGSPNEIMKRFGVKNFEDIFIRESAVTIFEQENLGIKKSKILEIKNLSINFGNFKAVDDISFSVLRGEIFGFLGANGAGKTTTIRAMCGLLKPSLGEIIIDGQNIAGNILLVKPRIGYMSQKFSLYQDLSVRENILFSGALYNMSKEATLLRMKEIFDFVDFKLKENEIVKNLSGGDRQVISLCASIVHNPDIIFLDEPTAGISPLSRKLFWNLIRRLALKGKTIFVTTHYMDEALYCEKIALMQSGKIIALDSPDNLKAKTHTDNLDDVFIKLIGKNEN